MQLPIKWNPPYKSKYLFDETLATNSWFIFGHYDDNKNLVGICDGDSDIFTHVPRDQAERLCEARNRFCAEMIAIMNEGTEWASR